MYMPYQTPNNYPNEIDYPENIPILDDEIQFQCNYASIKSRLAGKKCSPGQIAGPSLGGEADPFLGEDHDEEAGLSLLLLLLLHLHLLPHLLTH